MKTADFIYSIENILPDAKDLVDKLNSLPTEVWKTALVSSNQHKARVRTAESLFLSEIRTSDFDSWAKHISKTLYECLAQYQSVFPFQGSDKLEEGMVVKYKVGGHYSIHTDSSAQTPYRELSAILYLNDDYIGGEIFFPKENLRIKPKAGSCLLFPSCFMFPHTSLPIIKGVKYCIPTWFS